MSGKDKCSDNSAVESFLQSLKAEVVWRHGWHIRRYVEIARFQFINGFYNSRQWDEKSPVASEQKAAKPDRPTGTEPGQVPDAA